MKKLLFLLMFSSACMVPLPSNDAHKCLSIYSGGRELRKIRASRNGIAHSDGTVEFTNDENGDVILVKSDFIFEKCEGEK